MRDGVPTCVAYRRPTTARENFQRLDVWLRGRGLLTEGTVGYGARQVARASDAARVAVQALRDDAYAFLHARGGECGVPMRPGRASPP